MAKNSKLTPKQKKFADEYVKTGNATESYKNAGYKVDKMGYDAIRKEASKTLTKPLVQTYIESKMKEIESHKIMDAKEALERLTAIARGEAKQLVMTKDGGEFEVPPPIKEQRLALDSILKRYPLTDISKAQERKANAEARSAELDAEIKQAQLDSINQVADKAADKLDDWSVEDLRALIGKADENIAKGDN